MNREDIIRMAREAGGYTPERYPDEWRLDVDDLERFANLVAAEEREACAVIAFNSKTYLKAAAAIRARSNYEKLD